jgi:hypothetical protein
VLGDRQNLVRQGWRGVLRELPAIAPGASFVRLLLALHPTSSARYLTAQHFLLFTRRHTHTPRMRGISSSRPSCCRPGWRQREWPCIFLPAQVHRTHSEPINQVYPVHHRSTLTVPHSDPIHHLLTREHLASGLWN